MDIKFAWDFEYYELVVTRVPTTTVTQYCRNRLEVIVRTSITTTSSPCSCSSGSTGTENDLFVY